jgi:hypothetical protein
VIQREKTVAITGRQELPVQRNSVFKGKEVIGGGTF